MKGVNIVSVLLDLVADCLTEKSCLGLVPGLLGGVRNQVGGELEKGLYLILQLEDVLPILLNFCSLDLGQLKQL